MRKSIKARQPSLAAGGLRMASHPFPRTTVSGEGDCQEYPKEERPAFDPPVFCTYILRSRSNPEQRHIGPTSDLGARPARHNMGRCAARGKIPSVERGSLFRLRDSGKSRCFSRNMIRSLLIFKKTLIGQIGDLQGPKFVPFYETGRCGNMLNSAAALDLAQNLPDCRADCVFRLFQNDPVKREIQSGCQSPFIVDAHYIRMKRQFRTSVLIHPHGIFAIQNDRGKPLFRQTSGLVKIIMDPEISLHVTETAAFYENLFVLKIICILPGK